MAYYTRNLSSVRPVQTERRRVCVLLSFETIHLLAKRIEYQPEPPKQQLFFTIGPVSLTASVFALSTIFDIVLDCFKHVKVAKSFGIDYQTHFLRLENLHLRLSHWGETVDFDKEPTLGGQTAASSLSQSKGKKA